MYALPDYVAFVLHSAQCKCNFQVLGDKERPVGLCNAVQPLQRAAEFGIMLAVSQLSSTDALFPSLASFEEREIIVKYFSLPGISQESCTSHESICIAMICVSSFVTTVYITNWSRLTKTV